MEKLSLNLNLPPPAKGTIIKLGSGKNYLPILSINCYNDYTYQITHLPTGALVADGYLYLSLARSVSLTLVAELGDLLRDKDPIKLAGCFTEPLRLYLDCYKFKRDCKKAPSLEEFTNGTDYIELYNQERRNERIVREEQELAQDVCCGDTTLAWVSCKTQGTIHGADLGDLIEGRRTYSESFPL